MQKNLFSLTKKIGLLLLVFALFSVVISSSCNAKYAKDPSCVKLTKKQIQKWVDAGYTDSTNSNYMTAVRFRTAYSFPGTVFRVYVIGVRKKDGSLIEESLTELTAVDTCNKKHIQLSDYIFTGVNPADLSDLNILKSDGKIIDSLKYLQLDPLDYVDPSSKFHILAFNNYVIKAGSKVAGTAATGDQLLPCPPCQNCKTSSCPAPPTCSVCGPVTTDTTGNNP